MTQLHRHYGFVDYWLKAMAPGHYLLQIKDHHAMTGAAPDHHPLGW